MDLDLNGKVAIVTGGAGGIGKATCSLLAAEGVHVVVSDRPGIPGTEEVAAQIRGSGGRAVALPADVSDPEQIGGVVRDAIGMFGGVDILVNNAGMILRKTILDSSDEELDAVMRCNFGGCLHFSRHVARHMIETRRRGRIVNISSIHARLTKAGIGSYPSSKGAIELLSQTLAVELAPLGIAVNIVAPGPIQTEINSRLYTSEDPADRALLRATLQRMPMAEVGRPEDVAIAIAFLASAKATRFVTGVTLPVDGGYAIDGTPRP